MNAEFQYGTWIPTLQIGNGVIWGQYEDQTGNWTRSEHQIFINGFFRLNYTEAQVEDARRRNTTVEEIRIGTLPYESGSGASIFNLMISNNNFIQNIRPNQEIISIGARSIWGSPRMRIYANQRNTTSNYDMPIALDLSVQDLKPSSYETFVEIRVSGSYTAFPDLSTTDHVNTPPPMITQPAQPPQPVTYIVKAGDSLWSISQRFGTTVDKLMELNGLTSTLLNIGQMLVISR